MAIPHQQSLDYLVAHADELVQQVVANGEPVAITINGKVQAVLQDAASYHATRQQLALLQLLLMGSQQVAKGWVLSHDAVTALDSRNLRDRAIVEVNR